MRTASVLLAVVVVLVAAPACTDYEAGKEAYYRGDYDTALKEWRPLAEQGDAHAQNNLGTMHEEGRGVPQDYVQAHMWANLAASQGDATAQAFLGVMYQQGRGVPQDFVLAHMWENLAAAQGHEPARKYRDRLAARMTPPKLAEAQRLAREWKPKQ